MTKSLLVTKGKPSQRNIKRAKALGQRMALDMCQEILIDHPEYRGKNLTLAQIPQFMYRHAACYAMIEFTYQTRGAQSLKRLAGTSAKCSAIKWLLINKTRIKL